MEKQSARKSEIPYTCTLSYDRQACGDCVCASCYLQEFCDRCKDCSERSLHQSRCNAYEGALTY